MADQVDFDALKAAYDKEMDADYDVTDEELREILENMGGEVPEAFKKIGVENYWE